MVISKVDRPVQVFSLIIFSSIKVLASPLVVCYIVQIGCLTNYLSVLFITNTEVAFLHFLSNLVSFFNHILVVRSITSSKSALGARLRWPIDVTKLEMRFPQVLFGVQS
jgi:hypothetical protein